MLEVLQHSDFEHQKNSKEITETLPVDQLFNAYEKSLVSSAISAESRAEHWDDANRIPKMHLGCSILTLNKNFDMSQPAIYTGANVKLKAGVLPYPERKCSEMNAFENALGIKYPEKIIPEKYEEIEKEDLGLIAAIVTVSESRNTGELDTASDDVVYPCKQCMTNYEYLLNQGVLSPKTVIYNARIKEGQVVAGQPIPLEQLLAKFSDSREKMSIEGISELLNVRKDAFAKYRKVLHDINKRFGEPKDYPIVPGDSFKAALDVQRERVGEVNLAREDCILTIIKAMRSLAEEGVPKQRIVSCLGLSSKIIESEKPVFSKAELESIERTYEDYFMQSASALTGIK